MATQESVLLITNHGAGTGSNPVRLPGLPSRNGVLWNRLVLEVESMAKGKIQITVPPRHAHLWRPNSYGP